jgi:hypothetical protein
VVYEEVLKIGKTIRDPWFDPFRVKLIRVGDPLAKTALELLKRYPGPHGTNFGSMMFGGVYVDGAYSYPSPLPVSA